MPDGSIEYIVRPYQTPGSHGSIIIPSTPSGTREKAMLTWGAQSKMPDVVPKTTNVNVRCCSEGLKEAERQSETVRISQPGKPENYVDVARAVNVKLRKREKNQCGGSLQAEISSFWNELFQDMDNAFSVGGSKDNTGDKSCQVAWQLSNTP